MHSLPEVCFSRSLPSSSHQWPSVPFMLCALQTDPYILSRLFLWAPNTHIVLFTQSLPFDMLKYMKFNWSRIKTMFSCPTLFLTPQQNLIRVRVLCLRRCAAWKPRDRPRCFHLPVTSISLHHQFPSLLMLRNRHSFISLQFHQHPDLAFIIINLWPALTYLYPTHCLLDYFENILVILSFHL